MQQKRPTDLGLLTENVSGVGDYSARTLFAENRNHKIMKLTTNCRPLIAACSLPPSAGCASEERRGLPSDPRGSAPHGGGALMARPCSKSLTIAGSGRDMVWGWLRRRRSGQAPARHQRSVQTRRDPLPRAPHHPRASAPPQPPRPSSESFEAVKAGHSMQNLKSSCHGGESFESAEAGQSTAELELEVVNRSNRLRPGSARQNLKLSNRLNRLRPGSPRQNLNLKQ